MPAVIPVTRPVPRPTVMFVALVPQVPPVTVWLSVVVPPPSHIVIVPVMAAGAGSTVTTFVATQPALRE